MLFFVHQRAFWLALNYSHGHWSWPCWLWSKHKVRLLCFTVMWGKELYQSVRILPTRSYNLSTAFLKELRMSSDVKHAGVKFWTHVMDEEEEERKEERENKDYVTLVNRRYWKTLGSWLRMGVDVRVQSESLNCMLHSMCQSVSHCYGWNCVPLKSIDILTPLGSQEMTLFGNKVITDMIS